MKTILPLRKCRLCASSKLHTIIPLGSLPLANALNSSHKETSPRYNLEVMLCNSCGLAQLKDLICPKELFSDYLYFSSYSDTMLLYAAALTKEVIKRLPNEALVVEIASNDGYLLKNYVEKKVSVLGIEPAKNIATFARQKGVSTRCEFFTSAFALELKQEGKQADIIHANNVMAHVPDINDFIEGIFTLLKPKGEAIIEVPYFLDLVQKLEFDTIYHEHVYYFALKPLVFAFERHGLEIFHVKKLPIHGGSLRLFVGHKGAFERHVSVDQFLKIEKESNIFDLKTFSNFMERLNHLKGRLQEELDYLKRADHRIAAYGASAKGTTLLNYFDIGHFLDFVVDKSREKQGKYTPGTHLEIKAPKALVKEKSTHALLLAWNFASEIIRQQGTFISHGGKFILPLPEVKIVS